MKKDAGPERWAVSNHSFTPSLKGCPEASQQEESFIAKRQSNLGYFKNFLVSYKYLFEASPSHNNTSRLLSPYNLPAVRRQLHKLVPFFLQELDGLGIIVTHEIYLRSSSQELLKNWIPTQPAILA